MRTLLMDWFDLTAPILQAPIGGADTLELVTAVGAAGGLGSLPMTWAGRDDGLRSVEQLNRARCPYFLNFVLRFGTARPSWYLDRGVKAVTLSWGIDRDLILALKADGMRVGVQIGNVLGARRAIEAGADFIIAQGIEAGGHVQSSTPLRRLLPEVIAIAGATPVVAAGGIADGAGVAAALRAGAQAVMLGTRFVASEESRAHPAYKQALVSAGADDTVYTNCFDLDWPYAMHRVLRNTTFMDWEAAGCPAAPNRPGEDDIVATAPQSSIRRYCDTSAFAGCDGDVTATCLYAGTGVDRIGSILPARTIVETLWTEAKALL